MESLTTRFDTRHGTVVIHGTELDTDCDGNPVILYNCHVVTDWGSSQYTYPLRPGEQFDRDRAEQIAFCLTPQGKEAVKRRSQVIQDFLKRCKNS